MKTLAIDFDGVIRATDGSLMPDCYDSIRKLVGRWKMVCFTARYDLGPVEQFLIDNGLSHWIGKVTNVKPKADVYLDDRGLRFESWLQALLDLQDSRISAQPMGRSG